MAVGSDKLFTSRQMNHSGALGVHLVGMLGLNEPVSRRSGTRTVRQSVSIPTPLAVEVRRVAKERRLTISRALVTLPERGVRAEQDAKENLKTAYRRFLKEKEPLKEEQAGRDMIRAIFGKDSIAEDPIL